MIHVIARIIAVEGKRQELLDAFAEVVPSVLAEEGCRAYIPSVDAVTDIERQETLDFNAVTMVEQWESIDHLKAHLCAPHMLSFREKFGDLIYGSVLNICDDQIPL